MAVAFDSVGAGSSIANGTTITWQHVLSSSATALVVAVGFYAPNDSPTTLTRTVKVGTKVLTSLGTRINYGTGGWLELFGTTSPPTGAQNVTVTASTSSYLSGNSTSYTGVASLGTPVSNAASNGTIMSVAVTPASGGMAVAAYGSAYVQLFTGGNATLRWTKNSITPTVGIQDVVGTGSAVTLTLSNSGNYQWSAIAVPLVPAVTVPVAKTGAVSLSVTATPTAAAMGTKRANSVPIITATATANVQVSTKFAASLGLIVTPTATRTGTPHITGAATIPLTTTLSAGAAMTPAPLPPGVPSPLRYVGRVPDTLASVTSRSDVKVFSDSVKMTVDYINQAMDRQVPILATLEKVIQEDKKRATKAEVLAADEKHYPATGHGLATLDPDTGMLPISAAPLDDLVYDRTIKCHNGTVNITTASPAVSNDYRNVLLATCEIPDPGYPYIPLPFAWVRGADPTGTTTARWSGTGNTGRLLVMPTPGNGDVFYGAGACTATTRNAYSVVVPVADPKATPTTTRKPLTGATTLCLYGSCWTTDFAQSYTFSPTGLVFYVLLFPAA